MTKELLISSIMLAGVIMTQAAQAQEPTEEPTAEPSTTETKGVSDSSTNELSVADAEDIPESESVTVAPGAATASVSEETSPEEPSELLSSESPRVATNAQGADHDAVFRAFRVHARQERVNRFIRTGSGVAGGTALMGTGAIFKRHQDLDPTYFYLVGGATAGASLLGLFIKSEAEKMADRYRVDQSEHSEMEADALEQAWSKYAEKARSRRFISAVTSTIISVVSLGFGSAIAAGAIEMNDTDRSYLSAGLVVGGAAALFPAIGGFAFKSAAEVSYETFVASQDVQQQERQLSVELSLSTVAGGGVIGALGTF